jgi:hypothetical protein
MELKSFALFKSNPTEMKVILFCIRVVVSSDSKLLETDTKGVVD